MQSRRNYYQVGGQGHSHQKTTYPQMQVPPRISATSFWKCLFQTKINFQNIFKYIFLLKVGGGIAPALKVGGAAAPFAPPPCSYAYEDMQYNLRYILPFLFSIFKRKITLRDPKCCFVSLIDKKLKISMGRGIIPQIQMGVSRSLS